METHARGSLIPRPLPDFISQLLSFLHSCEIKSESSLGTRLCKRLVVTNIMKMTLTSPQGDPHLCCLDDLRFLVLDEADRMVEFGHYQEVGSIMDRLNGAKGAGSRQNLVFSATLTLPRQSVEQKRRKRKRMSGEESLGERQGGGICLQVGTVPRCMIA